MIDCYIFIAVTCGCYNFFFLMYIYVYEKQLGNLAVFLNRAVPPKIIWIKSRKLMLAESLRKG